MNICVFCASSEVLDQKYYEQAKILAQNIAKRNHTLVTGGSNLGIMKTLGSEIKLIGGNSIGIIPSIFAQKGLICYDYIETRISTDMSGRKKELISISDAFIIFPGGWGTLDEFFEIVTLNQIGLINKPIVIFNVDGFFDKLIDFIEQFYTQKFAQKKNKDAFFATQNIDEIFSYIEKF